MTCLGGIVPFTLVEFTQPNGKHLVHNHKNWFSHGNGIMDFLVCMLHVMYVQGISQWVALFEQNRVF